MRNVSSRITPMERSRRDFFQQSLGALGSVSLAMTLQMYLGHSALGQSPTSPGYGPLRPAKDETTGLELLKLPEGFRYVSYGWNGDAMTGGVATPGGHDGMGVIATSGSTVTLCRNHELKTWASRSAATPFAMTRMRAGVARTWSSTRPPGAGRGVGLALRAPFATAPAGPRPGIHGSHARRRRRALARTRSSRRMAGCSRWAPRKATPSRSRRWAD